MHRVSPHSKSGKTGQPRLAAFRLLPCVRRCLWVVHFIYCNKRNESRRAQTFPSRNPRLRWAGGWGIFVRVLPYKGELTETFHVRQMREDGMAAIQMSQKGVCNYAKSDGV